MSRALRPIDQTVDARLADILGDLGRLSASVHVAANILAQSHRVHLEAGVDAELLGLSLLDTYKGLLRAMDRLDSVHLLDPSREIKPAA